MFTTAKGMCRFAWRVKLGLNVSDYVEFGAVRLSIDGWISLTVDNSVRKESIRHQVIDSMHSFLFAMGIPCVWMSAFVLINGKPKGKE